MRPFNAVDEEIKNKKKQSLAKRNKDLAKHLRIANATSGHEREVHLAKAEKIREGIKEFNSFWSGIKNTINGAMFSNK